MDLYPLDLLTLRLLPSSPTFGSQMLHILRHYGCTLQVCFTIPCPHEIRQKVSSFLFTPTIQPIYTTSIRPHVLTLSLYRSVQMQPPSGVCRLSHVKYVQVYQVAMRDLLSSFPSQTGQDDIFYADTVPKISSTSQAPAQYCTWHLSPSLAPSCAIRRSRPRKRRQRTISWLRMRRTGQKSFAPSPM